MEGSIHYSSVVYTKRGKNAIQKTHVIPAKVVEHAIEALDVANATNMETPKAKV